MAGASSKRGDRMCTLPRLVGFKLQTLAVNAEKLCSGSPKASSDSGWTWDCRFDQACCGEVRGKGPSCAGAMRIGRVRLNRYSRPIFAFPYSEAARMLSVGAPLTL